MASALTRRARQSRDMTHKLGACVFLPFALSHPRESSATRPPPFPTRFRALRVLRGNMAASREPVESPAATVDNLYALVGHVITDVSGSGVTPGPLRTERRTRASGISLGPSGRLKCECHGQSDSALAF
jgi:hypothetical protein